MWVGWVGGRVSYRPPQIVKANEQMNEKNEKKLDNTILRARPPYLSFGEDAPARGRPPAPGIERKDNSGAATEKDEYGVVIFAVVVADAVVIAVVVNLGDPASEGREQRRPWPRSMRRPPSGKRS